MPSAELALALAPAEPPQAERTKLTAATNEIIRFFIAFSSVLSFISVFFGQEVRCTNVLRTNERWLKLAQISQNVKS